MANTRYASRLVALVGLSVTFGVRPALAIDRPCPSIAIESDVSLQQRWPELTEQLRQQLEPRGDIDHCAQIRLSQANDPITVHVTLPDGRSTVRAVSRREDLVPTVEALLLVPQQHQKEAAAPAELASEADASRSGPERANGEPQPSTPEKPSERATPPAAGAKAQREPTRNGAENSAPPVAASANGDRGGLRVEGSLLIGSGIGDGKINLGAGVLSFIQSHAWLGGVQARVDRYQDVSSPTAGGVVEVSALAGRRFEFTKTSLDVFGGPAFAYQGTASKSTVLATGQVHEESSTSTVPRLILGLRLNQRTRSVWRYFSGIEAGFGPARSEMLPSDAPRLPRWAVGVVFGITVGPP